MFKIIVIASLALSCGAAAAGWETSGFEDKLTGKKTPAIILDADLAEISTVGWPTKKIRAAFLSISCTKEKAALMFSISGHTIAKKGTIVSYRIDQNPPMIKQGWLPMQSAEGVGVFDRKAALPIIGLLAKAETLFIRLEDDSLGRTEAEFKLDGIRDAIKPLQDECKF